MHKRECDESRKKHQDGTWLNPKYQNNDQSEQLRSEQDKVRRLSHE